MFLNMLTRTRSGGTNCKENLAKLTLAKLKNINYI